MAGWTPQGCPSPWTLLAQGSRSMRLVCISDTHSGGSGDSSKSIAIPSGDVLVHAGDLTYRGRLDEVKTELEWIDSLPFQHKVVIAGNHDWLFQREPILARAIMPPGVTYLQDQGVDIGGFKFWGSPWQPEFCGWAFNLPRGHELAAKWAQIPEGTDVLVTHGPARKKLDFVQGGSHVGCSDLSRRIAVVKPLVHVCGHVHEGHGVVTEDSITYVNASICTREGYHPTQSPIVLDLWHDETGQRQATVIQGE